MKFIKIALLQQKGGSGKTTTSVNLCGSLNELSKKVAIGDMDSDKPDSLGWCRKGDSLTSSVIQLNEKNYRQVLDELNGKYEYVIIDTSPNFQTTALKALLYADFIIIPVSPAGMDISGMLEAVRIAKDANKPFKVLINKFRKIESNSKALLELLDEQEIPYFESKIPKTEKMVDAENLGLYIGDLAKNSNAHIEFRKLGKEIIKIFE